MCLEEPSGLALRPGTWHHGIICEQSLEKVSLLQKSILFPHFLCQSLGISWCSRVLKNILQVYLERSQIIKSYHNCPSIHTNSSLPCECDPVGSPPLLSHLWSRCLQGPPRLSLKPASLSASDGQHVLHSPLFSLHPSPLFSLYFCLFLDISLVQENICSQLHFIHVSCQEITQPQLGGWFVFINWNIFLNVAQALFNQCPASEPKWSASWKNRSLGSGGQATGH